MQLRDLIATAADNKQKILGLCFGSQIAALALGGKAGPLPLDSWQSACHFSQSCPRLRPEACY